MPEAITTIPGLREGEKVELCVRKHWIVTLQTFLGMLFGILLVGGTTLLSVAIFSGTVVVHYILLVAIILLLFVWLWGFVDILDDDLDAMILTNQRVLDITQTGLFHIKFRETSLDLIEDATGSNDGVLGNLIGFGTLTVETSATDGTLEIDSVADPSGVAREIMNRKNTFVHFQQAQFHNSDDPDEDTVIATS